MTRRAACITMVALSVSLLWTSPSAAQAEATASQCESAWQAVVSNETLIALEDFIRFFPTCPEADEARQRLTSLTQPAPEAADEESRGAAGGFDTPRDRTVYVPVGRLLARGAPMLAEGGGYGVILLSRDGRNNLAACEEFVRALGGFTQDRVDGWVEQIDSSYVYRRPVYWPTQRLVSATSARDCPQMLQSYDFDRAAVMMARLGVRDSGPFMALWRADGGAAGVLNYSQLPDAELRRQFDRSLRTLAQSDRVWDPDFYQPATLQATLSEALNQAVRPVVFVVGSYVQIRFPGLARQ